MVGSGGGAGSACGCSVCGAPPASASGSPPRPTKRPPPSVLTCLGGCLPGSCIVCVSPPHWIVAGEFWCIWAEGGS